MMRCSSYKFMLNLKGQHIGMAAVQSRIISLPMKSLQYIRLQDLKDMKQSMEEVVLLVRPLFFILYWDIGWQFAQVGVGYQQNIIKHRRNDLSALKLRHHHF